MFLCIKITGSVSLPCQPTMSTMQRKALHTTTVLKSLRLFTKFCHASVEFLDVCIFNALPLLPVTSEHAVLLKYK